ncbi:MAG: hypothetical protein Q7T55_09790 [Solirubrobacteraceae bacterium]|nr:hypothetical protein [Solirubrobacteraceae bacterium]
MSLMNMIILCGEIQKKGKNGDKYMSKKIKEYQNKPYYMNNCGKVEIKPIKEPLEKLIKKFQLGIDKNGNPIITIDEQIHFMNSYQFHAFTLGICNIAKIVNPEIDYSKILIH